MFPCLHLLTYGYFCAMAVERKRKTTLELHERIRSEYQRLIAVEEKGVRLYHNEYIVAVLSEQFYRSPDMIKRIIHPPKVKA